MSALAKGVAPRSPSVLWVNQFAVLPQDGGAGRHFELGRELVGRGWNVTLIASDLHIHRRTYTRRTGVGDRRVISERCEGVDLRWVWAAPYQRNDWRRAWNWLSFGRAVRNAPRYVDRPDIVIGSSPQLFAAHAARAAARRFGVPFVFEVRDLWPESLLAAGGKPGMAYKVLDRMARSLYRDADRIIVLAQGVRDFLVQRGIAAEKIIHIPNGVDVNSVRPVAAAALESASGRSFTAIYAGAHGPANGLDRVLDAAEQLAGTNIRFLLVGDGPAKPALVAEARQRGLSNVVFHDSVSKPELVKLFGEADAGLMILREAPLFSYGVSPNKLFDYMAAGLPIVCNVPGEVERLLAEARAGVQVPDTTGAALAAGISALARVSPQDRRRMGQSGREWVEREHSRDVLGQRLDTFLQGLLPKPA